MSECDRALEAWEADKPPSRRPDRHGRPELVVHPHLLRGPAPLPRSTGGRNSGSNEPTA